MYSDSFVPSRTQAGEASLTISSTQVTGKQRQFLRLIDGMRSLAQIGLMLHGRDLASELAELIELGMVVASPAHKPVAVSAVSAHPTLPERWHEAVVFMKAHARECLGIMAHPIDHLLERVGDCDAAKSAVARWHMALRESRLGRSVADENLDVVTEMLGI